MVAEAQTPFVWWQAGIQYVLPSIVAALLGPLILQRIRSKYDHARELEITQLRSDLQKLQDQASIQFRWLHEERAKAMTTIYGKLLEAQEAFEAFNSSWARFEGQPGPQERWATALEAGLEFQFAYRPTALLFPKALAERLGKLDKTWMGISYAYHVQLNAANGDENRAFTEMMKKPPVFDTNETLERIEAEFRRLYGVED